ncbi:cell division protein FtsB [Azohydromonas caseinilytica]|uniref:Cell division protein FtsB n=1 Tax=Azohydromonas caseinilytica TaxID=2728836 RepID=A0A848F8U7_9BURK|nr:cell division protein FtsB [Azohydromonas caseinilytica]NML14670.1 cell division protein FtsB [Azohydromonas caseinilytica]
MRLVTLVLLALLALVHYELWWSKGGVRNVEALRAQVQAQQQANAQAREVNQRMATEVADLREGLEMVEERARAELGMLKPDEILVQLSPARH